MQFSLQKAKHLQNNCQSVALNKVRKVHKKVSPLELPFRRWPFSRSFCPGFKQTFVAFATLWIIHKRISWQLFVSWAGKVTACSAVLVWNACSLSGHAAQERGKKIRQEDAWNIQSPARQRESEAQQQPLNWTCKQVFSLFMRFANLGGERVSK